MQCLYNCFNLFPKSCPILQPYRLQHARLLCSPLSPGVYSDSCPLSWWCYLNISSSVAPFSVCLQSFPASGSFPVSWLFTTGGQSTGASASVLPMNIQGRFPLGLIDLLAVQGTQESSPAPQLESINFSSLSLLYGPTITPVHGLLEKP